MTLSTETRLWITQITRFLPTRNVTKLVLLTAMTLLSFAAHAAAQTSWTYCAGENSQCSFSGTKEVRYGANGSYAYLIYSNGVACSNNFFGDPIYGTFKQCDYRDTTISTSTTPPPTLNTTSSTSSTTSNWTYCAGESAQCSFSGTKEVRYGANGSYFYGNFSNGVACSNNIFGDPIYGTYKQCDYRDSTSTTTTTATTSTPTTTTTSTSNWTYCARESSQCSFSGTKEVRYGANGSYFYGNFSNGVACSNNIFGDPIYGSAKQCDYRDSTSTTTTTQTTTTTSIPTTSTTTSTSGRVFYVAKNGNNSYSCSQAQSASTPKLSINSGITCLSTGDTLVVKAGTYLETISSYNINVPSGTANAPVSIRANSGDQVIIKAQNRTDILIELHVVNHLRVEGFILDGANLAPGVVRIGSGSTNVTIQGNEIKGATYNGIMISDPGTSYVNIIGNDIHDNGHISGQGYGIYTGQHNILIERNFVHHNARYGVHFYSEEGTLRDNIVRHNFVYNNSVKQTSAGLLIGGQRHLVYNNVIWNEPGPGIEVNYTSPADIKVYNNTLYNTAYNSFLSAIYVEGGASGTAIRNNILNGGAASIRSDTSSTTVSNNLTANAQFVDAANGNFAIRAGSPAINAGMDPSGLPGVEPVDMNGTARPQGGTWDIGAYEYR